MRRTILASGFAMIALTMSGAAPAVGTVRMNFQNPVAVALDSKGAMYVLDAGAGAVNVVSRAEGARLVRTFGSEEGRGRSRLLQPTDVAVDQAGNVVVADAGNFRVIVFKPSGEMTREVSFPGQLLQRVLPMPDGSLRVLSWDGSASTLWVKALDSNYRPGPSFSVDTSCGVRLPGTIMADLATDRDGNLWLVDHYGCEDQYTLRKFAPDGKELGTWSRSAGQISLETQRTWGNRVVIVSGLFADGEKIYVILGAGGAETGGLDVDVWTSSGSYLRRTKLVGPSRGVVRAVVHDGSVYVVDSDGLKTVIGIDLNEL